MDSRSVMNPESRHEQAKERARDRAAIAFSNAGHTCTHMFTVLYATAVLYLPQVFGLPYGELLSLSSLGLVLFGVAALPAGWLGRPLEPGRHDGDLLHRDRRRRHRHRLSPTART